jgi:hypothetical protein
MVERRNEKLRIVSSENASRCQIPCVGTEYGISTFTNEAGYREEFLSVCNHVPFLE